MTVPTRSPLTDARLDRLIAQVLEDRAEGVAGAALPPQAMADRMLGRRGRRPQAALARLSVRPAISMAMVLLLLLLALAGAIVGSRMLDVMSPEVRVIHRLAEALGAGDVETLRSLFTPDGSVTLPRYESGQPHGKPEMQVFAPDTIEVDFIGSWPTRDTVPWGLEALVRSCAREAPSTVVCDVVTRWHTLQVEMVESWLVTFDGERIASYEARRVDTDPRERALPLGMSDLARWESWLRRTDPTLAAELLQGDYLFWNTYFSYFSPSASEIGASIREFLADPDSSFAPSPTPEPSYVAPGITGWTPYTSELRGFTMGYPEDWSVNAPATREWQAGDVIGLDEWPYADTFISPDQDAVGLFVWEMPAGEGAEGEGEAGVESRAGLEAWAQRFCRDFGASSCQGFTQRAMPMCLNTGGDPCRPALLVPTAGEQYAFFVDWASAVFTNVPDMVRVVVIAREDGFPAAARYGGSVELLKAILTTMDVRS